MKKTILDDDTDSYQAAEGENESDQTNPLLMKTILSNVASGITAVILRGNSAEYLYSNDQFYRMLKYTREQFQEKTSDIYTIFHPDDRERIRAAVNSLKPNDAPLTIEYRAICRDNSIIYVRMVIAALRYRPEDSEIQVSIFEDITEEHKEMERQRELIENLPCGAGMYDISDGMIRTLYVNKRYLELVGRKQEDIVISALDVVMPEDREHLRGKIRKLVADGKDQESELHILNSNGHYIPFLIHCSILHQRSDTTTIYVTYTSIADDVLTFRHMLPVALETMMSASMDLSFIKDSALTYVCASRAFAEMAGYQNEKDLIGKTDYDIFTREFADCYRADDRKLIESGQSLVDYIERIPMKDGRVRYSNTSKYLLRDSMGNIIGLYGIGRDVTENREAFDRLKMLTDSIPGGLATYELSPSGIRSLYLSDGIFPIVGYSKNDDSNRFNNPLNFIVEEDKAELYRQLDRIWKISTPVDCYFRIRRKDRTLRWINFRAKIAERNEDRVIINAVLFDVHEQKEASLKLSEAEHQNKIRYEHELQLRKGLVKDSIIYYQINLTTGIFEEYMSKLDDGRTITIGRKIEQSIINHILSITHPDDVEKVYNTIYPYALFEAYQNGERSLSVIYRRKISGNTYHWVKANAFMVEKPDSNEVIAFIYCYDIDREWKDHLSIETQLNEDIESIFHIDTLSGIAYISHMQEAANYNKVYDSFDFEKECEIAKSKVVLKEDREAFIQFYDINNLKKLLSKDKLVSISYHVKENKSIYKKLVTAYYLDDQKSIIVLTRRDITKLAEEDQRQKKELQEAVERANAANKAKSDFLSHMSHDLRTPLNAVLAFSNPVLLDKASPEELRSYLNKVNVSGEYLLGIINDVLDMSRIEQNKVTLNPEPYYLVDFQNTINNVIGELSAKKNIEFIMDVHKASSKGIVVDRVRFNQIFVNLLSNAVKFTPSGGRVEFILDEEKRIEGNKVLCRFIVRDNGIGMSTDFIPHAFDSFHQEYRKDVAERYQGTGLGLPIVKELVRLMSGSIELVSEINCGTTFTVSIPFEEAELLMEKVPVPKQDYSRLCGIHILLVEDNEINLEIVQALLSKYECLVECAEDGEIAINKFKASPIGYYNIILMDIRMPGMDGITATKLIRTMDRSDARTVPIIATTADAFSEDEQLANDAGMNAHIAKPINPDRLYETCCRFVM